MTEEQKTLKAPWSVQPAPGVLYRGLALRLPEELRGQIAALLGDQSYDDETFGQHLKVGPLLLKHIQQTHGGFEQPTAGLGTFWTTNRQVAEDAIAATQSFNQEPGLLPVMMTADWDGKNLDFDRMNAGPHNWVGDKEQVLKPGTPLRVKSVQIRHTTPGWYEVLNPGDDDADYRGMGPGPQEHTASFDADYARQRWEEGSRFFFAVGGTPEQQPWEWGNGLGFGHEPLGLNPNGDMDNYKKDLDATARNFNNDYFANGQIDGHPGRTKETVMQIIREKAMRHGRDPETVAKDLLSHPAIFPAFHWYTMQGYGPGADDLDFMDAGAPVPKMPAGFKPQYDRPQQNDYLWKNELGQYNLDKQEVQPPHGTRQYVAYSPPTYTYRGPKIRPVTPQPAGYDDGSDYSFTGSPETQYHHRNITPETLNGIEKREDSVDDYYAEMSQRKAQGLESIPWNEWLDRVAYIQNVAMAWDEWAPKVQHQDHGSREGRYVIPQAGAFLDYYRRGTEDNPQLFISGIYTHPDNRNDGVAEALMRRLVDDHPGVPINPGYMTPDGQKFHDQMLEKEPSARELVTAAVAIRQAESLLVGPDLAYDETDWFARHYRTPVSQGVPPNADWYHVSPHMMPVGTLLQPMHGETPWNDDPYDHGLQNRANWIWVEYDKDKAKAWMHWVLEHQPNCYIYRVEPRVGPFAWNGTADEGWVTDQARVVEFLDQISHDLQFQEKERP